MVSNAVHPGLVASEFGKKNGFIFQVGVPVFHFFARLRRGILSPEKSAQTLVYLAETPEAATFSGKYIVDKNQVGSSVQSYDHDLAAHLWGISELLIQQCVPALKAEADARAAAATSESFLSSYESPAYTETPP